MSGSERRRREFTEVSPGNRMLAVPETQPHLDVLVDRGRLTGFDDAGTRCDEAA